MKIKQRINKVILKFKNEKKTFEDFKNLTQEQIFQKHLQELLNL